MLGKELIKPNANIPFHCFYLRGNEGFVCKLKSAVAVIVVESAVKYSFVQKWMQTTSKGQYKAEFNLSLRLHLKPLITAIIDS